MSGFERFLEILDTEPEIKDSENAVELKDVQGKIEFHNVSFSYNDKTEVLRNINLTIDKGQTVALVGPSGGGKTTFCSLIPRFYEVNEGSITIDGIYIRDITLSSLRQNVGVVQQDVYLFSGTVRDNILYGKPDATDEKLSGLQSLPMLMILYWNWKTVTTLLWARGCKTLRRTKTENFP